VRRVFEHKEGSVDGFTKKYAIKHLVYFETVENSEAAIARETQIKAWRREWKIKLIETANPYWNDLYGEIF
jgi:putative endonuclease